MVIFTCFIGVSYGAKFAGGVVEERHADCSQCRRPLGPRFFNNSQGSYCFNCVNMCAICKRVTFTYSLNAIQRSWYCNDCCSSSCMECKKRFRKSSLKSDNGHLYCQGCLDAYYAPPAPPKVCMGLCGQCTLFTTVYHTVSSGFLCEHCLSRH